MQATHTNGNGNGKRQAKIIPSTDKLVDWFIKSKQTGKPNPWIGRGLNLCNDAQKSEYLARIRDLGQIPTGDAAPEPVNDALGTLDDTGDDEPEDDGTDALGRRYVPRGFWDEERWNAYIELIWRMRQNAPSSKFGPLIDKAMSQMPEEQRRSAHAAFQTEVSNRLIQFGHKIRQQLDERTALQSKIEQMAAAPSKAEVLAHLSEADLSDLTKRVLDLLSPGELIERAQLDPRDLLEMIPLPDVAAFLVRRITETTGRLAEVFCGLSTIALPVRTPAGRDMPASATPAAAPVAPRTTPPHRGPARVLICGLKGSQLQNVQSRLHGKAVISAIENNHNNMTVPQSTDLVVVWTRFSSHQIQESVKRQLKSLPHCRFMLHRGGLETMSELITSAIRG